jgi:hypothetical protein
VVIESHNRVGGDRISELVQAAYGIDLDLFTLGWPFRVVPELSTRPRPLRAAATRFLVAEPGRVTAIEGVEEVRAHPDTLDLEVNVAVGDTVGPLEANWSRLGQIVATGTDTTAAIAACEHLLSKITVTTRSEG